MNFEELKSEELVACGECKALEELVQKQKVRLFAIPEQKNFLLLLYALDIYLFLPPIDAM
jgi:hypothetical protein